MFDKEFTRLITWRQVIAVWLSDPQTKPVNLGCKSVCRLQLLSLFTV